MISNNTVRSFNAGQGKEGFYYSLPALEEAGVGKISRLPVSIRIVLESVLRNCDVKRMGGRWPIGTRESRQTRKFHLSSPELFFKTLQVYLSWWISPRCARPWP